MACASADGLVPGMTGTPAAKGAPAEQTCQSCHDDLPLNPDALGRIILAGVPAIYDLGRTYELTVQLVHPDAVRWGFQLTAIGQGGSCGAGSFKPLPNDRSTQRSESALGRVYIQHGGTSRQATGIGTRRSYSWKFNWTAPTDDRGAVRFYGSAIMANGDGANTGDRIYTPSPTPLVAIKGPGVGTTPAVPKCD